MRFGIDATGWLNRRGFGRFTRNAVSRLVALDGESDYILLADDHTSAQARFPPCAHVRTVSTSRPPAEAAAEGSNRAPRDMLRLVRTARTERLDALLFPSLHTWFPSPGTPTCVGIHDTIPEDLPELAFPSRRDRTLWRVKQRLAVRSARRLFAVSDASRSAVAERFGIDPRSVAVVPEAPDPVFSPRGPGEIAEVRAAVGAPERYILFAGGISPHKNVGGLVGAYATARKRLADPPALVLVGSLDDEVYAIASAHPRLPIVLWGAWYVDERLLVPLLDACPGVRVGLAGDRRVFNPTFGVEQFTARYGPGRLIFGSGWPRQSPGPYLTYVRYAAVAPRVRDAILGDTVRELLAGVRWTVRGFEAGLR